MKFSKHSILIFFIISVIAGIGLFLRSRVAYTTELWLDESISARIASQASIKEIIFQEGEINDIQHSSGYYLLLKAWITFGYFNDYWMRTLSLLFFIPTLLVILKLSQSVSPSKIQSIFAIAFFSVHPLLVSLGYQVRMYAIALFFCTLALLFLLHKYQEKKIYLILSGFFLATAVYFDYLALWLIIGLFLLLPYLYRSYKNIFDKTTKVLLLTLILIIPQLLILSKNYVQSGDFRPGSVPQETFTIDYFISQSCKIVGICFENKYLTTLFLIFCFFILVFKTNNINISTSKFLILAVIFISTLYSLINNPILLARNLSITSILFIIVLADYLDINSKKNQIMSVIISVCYLTFMLISSITLNINSGDFFFGSGYDDFAQSVAENKSLIILFPDYMNTLLTAFYFPNNKVSSDQLIFVGEEISREDEQKILSAKKITLAYDPSCIYRNTCNLSLARINYLCSENKVICEVFFIK